MLRLGNKVKKMNDNITAVQYDMTRFFKLF